MEAAGQGQVPLDMVTTLEQALGLKFPEGRNSSVRFMAHLWEPLKCHYRPLAVYLVLEWLGWLMHRALTWGCGFECTTARGCR